MRVDASRGELRFSIINALPAERQILTAADSILAAVLLAVVTRATGPTIIFTTRALTVEKHKGQISLPGGAVESFDRGPIATALREAHEEIGLDPKYVEVLGLLDDSVTTSGFTVTPVVALVDPRAPLAADPREVAEVFEVPLALLRDPGNRSERLIEHRGTTFTDHRFVVDGKEIWGATGRIVAGFIAALERAR